MNFSNRIMKFSNNNRNLIKIAILIFILLSSIYILYFYNNYKTMENLANARDCSDCNIRPSSGKCLPIYDISMNYSIIPDTTNKYRLDICNIITNNVFCEWESRCTYDNIATQNERMALSNSNINQSIYDVTCCSGSSFYDNSAINFNYSIVEDNAYNIDSCSTIKNYIRQNIDGTLDLSYDKLTYNATNRICNTLEPSGPLFNKRGMLFSKTQTNSNIFTDVKTMPSDIINYISFSNIRNEIRAIINGSKTPTISPALLNGFNDISLNSILTQLTQLNDTLALKARTENLQRQLNRSDLTASQNANFVSILNSLQSVYGVALPNSLLFDRKDFTYRLVNNTKNLVTNEYSPYTPSPLSVLNSNQYLLNSDQFFNCMGEVKSDISASFTTAQLADFSNNDYFGTSGRPISEGGLGQAGYSALGSIQNTGYPSNNDLEMELRRLETIPSSGSAPVSVISSYLNAINSFYEKQIKNLTGPREHSYNNQLVFDNNSLETKQPTFFTYNKDANNVYDCKPSILGNSKFEYCGPEAYYESPNF
jgi:hypothetical protein